MLTKIGQKLLEMIPGLFFCAMFFGSYLLGFSSGVNKMQEEVVQLKLDHAEAKNTANELLVAQLTQSQGEMAKLQTKAQQTSKALAEANQTIQRQAAETKKGIQDAIAKDKSAADGKCIDGLGATANKMPKPSKSASSHIPVLACWPCRYWTMVRAYRLKMPTRFSSLFSPPKHVVRAWVCMWRVPSLKPTVAI